MKIKKKITKATLRKREKRLVKRIFREKLNKWKNEVITRDNVSCQRCGKNLNGFNLKGQEIRKHVHHIISLQSIKRKYPELLEDTENAILLCGFCHKFAPDSPHQGSFEFVRWLKNNKYTQYEYLMNKLEELEQIAKLKKIGYKL